MPSTPHDCPRCRANGTVAELVPAGDGQWHACASCDGRWLTAQVWAQCVAEAPTLAEIHAPPVVRRPDPSRLSCPMCHKLLVRAYIDHTREVLVDRCHQDGIWFDAGEVEQALARAQQHARARPGVVEQVLVNAALERAIRDVKHPPASAGELAAREGALRGDLMPRRQTAIGAGRHIAAMILSWLKPGH